MANKWLAHVKKTMKSHKGKKFGDILKMAKKTYKGGADVEGSPSMSSGPLGSAASVGGRRRTRKGRKSRRGGMEEMKGMGMGMY
jgi:hypothetical protein